MKKEMALANRYENGLKHNLKYIVMGTGSLHNMDPAYYWEDRAFTPEVGTIKREGGIRQNAEILADLALEGYTILEGGHYDED